ncbi:hypothetical protein [Agromyces mariniharenae]|uniref:Uncharacterized protein n=1 Tax=Agromyces mariniharenae TaxID=2604423 RepID=A0A5S4UZQ6_9MICO|nr:hypothetical protein [Agromyces mariniharenae]TYL52434.1 hypothetical protein FYC51_01320 [Agromyces mariniharenae]
MSAPDPTNGLGEGLKRAADAATPRPVDIDAVLVASRSRRRTRRTAIAGGAGALAAVLVVGGLVIGLRGGGVSGGSSTADAPVVSESADGEAEAGQGDAGSGLMLAMPERVYRCGAAVAPVADPTGAPLAVTVAPPVAPVPPGGSASVMVTVTNTGTVLIEGELSRVPAITVADVDVVAWHSTGTSEAGAIGISLAPGESVTLPGVVEALRCTAADDDGTGLPPDLPPLSPGPYGLGAAVAFSTPAEGMVLLLSSPLVPMTVG